MHRGYGCLLFPPIERPISCRTVSCFPHTSGGAENQGDEWTIFNLIDALLICPLFHSFMLRIACLGLGFEIGRCARVEHPNIWVCTQMAMCWSPKSIASSALWHQNSNVHSLNATIWCCRGWLVTSISLKTQFSNYLNRLFGDAVFSVSQPSGDNSSINWKTILTVSSYFSEKTAFLCLTTFVQCNVRVTTVKIYPKFPSLPYILTIRTLQVARRSLLPKVRLRSI